MSDTFTITITKEVSYNDLWNALWGSDGTGMTYWCSKIRKPDGSDIDLWTKPDWNPNPQDFKVYDFEEGRWHTITLERLAEAYRMAVEQNLTHCGDCRVDDLEDPDACSGDILIQLACFGEVIYG